MIGRSAAPRIPDTAVMEVVDARGQSLPPIESETGLTVLGIARNHSIDIPSYCGGRCSCGTCRIVIEGSGAGLSALTPNEAMVLGDSQVRSGERLACQARLIGPVRVHLLDLF
jgi:ferredoxin